MSPSLQGNSVHFPPSRQSSSPTRALSRPENLSACPQQRCGHPTAHEALRPPHKPEPGSFKLCPDYYQGAPSPSGPGTPPRLHANRFPESTDLLTSAARQRGVFLSYSGVQLGGPGALLPIIQSPPRTPDQTNQSAVSSGPEAGTEIAERKARHRPTCRLPPLAASVRRRGARSVAFAFASTSFCGLAAPPRKYFVCKPHALGVQEDPHSECSLKSVLP